MPELPEVEIVKRSLKKTVQFKRILKVIVNNKNLRFTIQNNFEENLKNKKILKIIRIAKYIILELSGNAFLVVHFGMSGTFHYMNNRYLKRTNLSFYHSPIIPKKHNHIEIIFSNFKIVYNDPRRFGFFFYFNSKKKLNKYLNKNGLDPLNIKFNPEYIKSKIKNRSKNIKNILLDQKIISGIGNIYASEILFYSKIKPTRKGKNIKNYEISRLFKNSKFVLKKAIRKGGSSIRNFKDTKGNEGSYQNEFKVYDKENKLCPNKCSFKIKKITISNRSSFYCKNCQK